MDKPKLTPEEIKALADKKEAVIKSKKIVRK